MTRKYILSLAAATIGSGLIAVTAAHAFGPGGHGHHHGSAAVKACIAVMTPTQRADLKSIFATEKSTLRTDHQNVFAAKQTLDQVILGLSKESLRDAESALGKAKTTLQADEDTLAGQICSSPKVLSAAQLTAAQNLYTGLVALRETTHNSARALFKAAHAASDSSSAVQGQGQE